MKREPRFGRAAVRLAAVLLAVAALVVVATPAATQGPTGPLQQQWAPWGVPICWDFCLTYGPLHNCCGDGMPPIQVQ